MLVLAHLHWRAGSGDAFCDPVCLLAQAMRFLIESARTGLPLSQEEHLPEAGGLGKAQAVEGQQLEGLRQDELATGGRSCAVLAVAEELVDAVAQHLVLATCQCVAWHLPPDLAGC